VATLDLSHKSHVLYLASIERMAAAQRMIDQTPKDYVLANYVAGLAVECILQALALEAGASHDARHSLSAWLSKCPASLHHLLKGKAEWNLLVALWDNGLRYYSYDGLLGYFRDKGYARGKKGGVESKVRATTNALVNAADYVHKKGLAVWVSSTRK
jgi:hypothetical protein